jgi:transposase
VWRQDTSRAAEPRARLSRRALRWAQTIACQHLSVARVAEALAVSWDTANNAVLGEGRRVLIDDPTRLDRVAVIGVDEHAWRHTRRDDKSVTVIIDLTPVRDGTGPARLLDMVQGRSKAVFKTATHWTAPDDVSSSRPVDTADAAATRSTASATCCAPAPELLTDKLRGTALGFRNLTNYIARSLLETGGFRPRLHPRPG